MAPKLRARPMGEWLTGFHAHCRRMSHAWCLSVLSIRWPFARRRKRRSRWPPAEGATSQQRRHRSASARARRLDELISAAQASRRRQRRPERARCDKMICARRPGRSQFIMQTEWRRRDALCLPLAPLAVRNLQPASFWRSRALCELPTQMAALPLQLPTSELTFMRIFNSQDLVCKQVASSSPVPIGANQHAPVGEARRKLLTPVLTVALNCSCATTLWPELR